MNGRGRCGARAISAPTWRRAGRPRSSRPRRAGTKSARSRPRTALRAELERRELLLAAAAPAARTGPAAELVLAADQFLIAPVGRVEDAARARAGGRRDPHRHRRLPLVHRLGPRHHDQPGRADAGHRPSHEAGWILRTFAHYMRDGLIPNMFPEGEKEGLYHTADATLWFFHAMDRYLELTGDRATLQAAAAETAWTSSSITRAARASASAWIPRTACCGRGRRATSSPGWTPRWAIGW